MGNEKIVGIVVVYKPIIKDLIDNINCYVTEIDMLLIWLNSELDEIELNELKNNIMTENYKIIKSDKNLGLAKPYNYAIEYAKDNSFKYLMTMDQDSKWYGFHDYLSFIMKSSKDNSVGIFGPRICTKEHGEDNSNSLPCEFTYVDHVISSGCVYAVDIFEHLKGFNEHFFIDALDEELCYRARRIGIKTAKVPYGYLFQRFGERETRSIFNRKIYISNYSPTRYYFIVRNHMWLNKKEYLTEKEKKFICHNYIASPFVKVLLFENNKSEKLKSIIKGFIHGMRKESQDGKEEFNCEKLNI